MNEERAKESDEQGESACAESREPRVRPAPGARDKGGAKEDDPRDADGKSCNDFVHSERV
jgi:hypothetical protein